MSEIFHYDTLQSLEAKVKELGLSMQTSKDTSILATPVKVGSKTAANRFCVLPMEGCDSNPDGSPSELTRRRYLRFARGGSALLWWEANAVVEEGKANPKAMFLTKENLPAFQALIKDTQKAAKESWGGRPLQILQLTHSGRWSRHAGEKPQPIIAQHDPLLDPRVGLTESDPVATDEYLESLTEAFVEKAKLAVEAGFDGVDIKACHRYLFSELLGAYLREGKYGGSYENRTRLLLDTIRAVKKAVPEDFIIACRFNAFDYHPYPYGFGEDREDWTKYDLTEPIRLTKDLVAAGCDLLTNSAGNPYYIYPGIGRPFDHAPLGVPMPEEHQLQSVQRLFDISSEIQKAAGNVPTVEIGYTYLHQYAPYFAAENIKEGKAAFLGFGRMSIAYPDAAKDFLTKGKLEAGKCCACCSCCTQIMRDHGSTGCVIRDKELYGPIYRSLRAKAAKK